MGNVIRLGIHKVHGNTCEYVEFWCTTYRPPRSKMKIENEGVVNSCCSLVLDKLDYVTKFTSAIAKKCLSIKYGPVEQMSSIVVVGLLMNTRGQ